MWGVLPTLTPPGWTTLVTGAWPSTHRVMDFNIYQPGTRIDDNAWGINTRLSQGRVPLEHRSSGPARPPCW